MKTKIAFVSCTIRARANQEIIIDGIQRIQDESQLTEHIERSLREKKISNSERGLMCATFGAQKYDVELEYINLKDYFIQAEGWRNIDMLIRKLEEADGIIFATPVYFGHRTALLDDLLNILKERNIDLYPKVVGFISVGAKRQGGQETTILFSAWDVMELGTIVVNDGHPISQFGGTCVAGLIGATAEEDSFGIRTSIGVGKRVAETALMLKLGNLEEKVEINLWDIPEIMRKYRINYDLACAVCPDPKAIGDYKCIDYTDDMSKLHHFLVSGHGIIPRGFSMKFFERTRYLRRDDFRLTFHVVRIDDIRLFPIFIKENSILCREHHEEYTKLITSGRKQLMVNPQYVPIGHEVET